MLDLYVIGCGGIGGYLIERLPMVISSLSLDALAKISSEATVTKELELAGNRALPCVVDSLTLIDGDIFNPRNAIRQGAGAGSKLVIRMRDVKSKMRSYEHIVEKLRQLKVTEEAQQHLQQVIDGLDANVKAMVEETNLPTLLGMDTEDVHMLKKSLESEMIKVSFLQRMRLVGYDQYICPRNMQEMIPPKAEENIENMLAWKNLLHIGRVNDDLDLPKGAVVFLCVDNVKTRYEVSKYMERFPDCLVLNGGNSKTAGHVTAYERKSGAPLDPAIYEVYPNITPDADKRPDEDDCTAVAPKHDQIAVTNSMIADIMLAMFIRWAREGLYAQGKGPKGAKTTIRKNEVLVDIESLTATPMYHPL